MDYIGYGTPISAAKAFMTPELVEGNDVTYPDSSRLTKGSSYAFLPPETSRYVEELFMKVRNS